MKRGVLLVLVMTTSKIIASGPPPPPNFGPPPPPGLNIDGPIPYVIILAVITGAYFSKVFHKPR